MPYSIRVLSRSDRIVPVAQLEKRLRRDGLATAIEVVEGAPSSWRQLLLKHRQGAPIVRIQRNPIEAGGPGAGELEGFRQEVGRYKPGSAALWLQEYLGQVRCVYVIQVLGGTEEPGGWDAIHAVQWEIWTTLGGILQADGEGFSNEDGYHILWQFPDDAAGPWNVAVLGAAGRWVAFEMDLGDPGHRRAFLGGQAPEGARRL